ncbi:hypothetical protein M5689_010929 [Euphorbia peplus]|nr:hypothetical protein M5689_010929 [Euphorbia peplus]
MGKVEDLLVKGVRRQWGPAKIPGRNRTSRKKRVGQGIPVKSGDTNGTISTAIQTLRLTENSLVGKFPGELPAPGIGCRLPVLLNGPFLLRVQSW